MVNNTSRFLGVGMRKYMYIIGLILITLQHSGFSSAFKSEKTLQLSPTRLVQLFQAGIISEAQLRQTGCAMITKTPAKKRQAAFDKGMGQFGMTPRKVGAVSSPAK